MTLVASQVTQWQSPVNARDSGSIPGLGRSLEKEMAVHFSILAWEIPQTWKPGGLVHGVTKSRGNPTDMGAWWASPRGHKELAQLSV